MEPEKVKKAATPTPAPAPQKEVVEKVSVKPEVKGPGKGVFIAIGFLVILAGVSTGWLLSGNKGSSVIPGKDAVVVPGGKANEKEAGISDESTFPDSAEGTLEEGGIDGEGTHHLVREGGESQNVYLTSTVIDLQGFTGKKVTIWGQTVTARKAGWLMDVGKIRVAE